jgi:hypothetical protein
VILVSVSFSAATPPSSNSYKLQQNTANSGGEPIVSASYRFDGSVGQESTVGTSSSTSASFVLQSGFWSFAGSGLAPVTLTVNKNQIYLDHIDLFWTGNNAPYDIYQATDCTNVFSSFFDSTASNSYSDIAPVPVTLVCYSVLATSPGRQQSPEPSSKILTRDAKP